MPANKFIGTWKLVSYERKSPDGQVSYPVGSKPTGYLIYTEDGYMSVAFMAANRARVEIPLDELSRAKGAFLRPKYLRAALRYIKAATTYVSYGGSYEIIGDTIVHHVETSLFPDWTSTALKRTFEFIGNRLSLRAHEPTGYTQELVWERA